MEGRFAGRTWKLAGIRKVRVTIGTAEQNKRGDKNMLSQMNYRKETQPHGDELFPLSIHVFETDLQSTVRVYCHWHEEVELFYAVKGEAVFHMDTETFLLREGETAFVNANRLHEVEGIDGQEFTFLAVVFQPRFLSGTSLDRIQQQYIEPVLSSEIRFPSKTERGDTPCRKKRHRPCRRSEICRKEKNRAGSCC